MGPMAGVVIGGTEPLGSVTRGWVGWLIDSLDTVFCGPYGQNA